MPLLVDWTAKIAVMWVRFSGVPIYQEGAYFNIPSGSWSIVEACSGIGYLSTCVMLGCLYAWAFYGSALKRAAFVIGATIIGIVGNWIRVYLTVMIAHLSDNRLLRDDHSAFGWAVFAVLGSAYCWVGMIFRNDEPHEIVVGDRKCDARELRSASEKPTSRVQILAVSCAVIATLAIWPIFQLSLERHHQFSDISVADMQLQRGWTTTNLPFTTWTPELQNPLRTRVQIFEKDGHRVGVFIGIFRNQSWQSKLVTSVNQLATYENPDWKIFIRGTMEIEFLGGPLVVDTGLITGHGFRVLAWHWYWVDGVATANGPLAKSLQIRRLLRGKDDTAAWIALFSDANMSNEIANHTLEEFMRDMGESLQRALLVTTNENRHP